MRTREVEGHTAAGSGVVEAETLQVTVSLRVLTEEPKGVFGGEVAGADDGADGHEV